MSKNVQEEILFHTKTAEDTVCLLKTDRENGLKPAEAAARLRRYGENVLQKGRKKTVLQRFLLQFGDFMVLILLAAAAVSFTVSCLEGKADLAEPLLILGIVMANAVIGTVQEARAEHALEALRSLSAPKAEVLRGGRRQVIPGAELVPGDR